MLKKIRHYFLSPRFHFNRLQLNFIAISLLSCGFVVGTYFTLSKAFPTIFAINNVVKVWTFSTANAGDYTVSQINSSDVVTVDDSGAYPTGGAVGANEFTNPGFASGTGGGDADNWTIGSLPASGWVIAPGNSATYGTTDFAVMQYEAKYDCTGDGDGDTAADCSATADSPSLGVDWRDVDQTSTKVVSSANGAPIVHISETEAISACPAGSHLITNDEWMTLARNIEPIAANWADGSVGSLISAGGGLKEGNNGSSSTSNGYDGTNPEYGTSRNALAKHVLSNGSEIYDLSGNVGEWASFDADNDGIYGEVPDDLIPRADHPDATYHGFTVTGWVWIPYGSPDCYTTGVDRCLLNNGQDSWSYDDFRPTSGSYNGAHGAGRINGVSSSTDHTPASVVRRSMAYADGIYASIFSVYLQNDNNSQNLNTGFRCATDGIVTSQSYSSSSGRSSSGGVTVAADTNVDSKLYQAVNVGDTVTYDFTAYVYDNTAGNVGGTVDATVAQLLYNDAVVGSVSYSQPDPTNQPGWYLLTGSVTGVASSVNAGVVAKAGKTIIVDDITLSKQGEYSVYITTAYNNNETSSWDTFCQGSLSGETCTDDSTINGNASVKYQICPDDGSTCEAGASWQYWDGAAWQTASNTTSHVNTPAELDLAAMQALSTTNKKIAIKAIFSFGGADVPYIPHLSVGLSTDTTAPETNASVLTMKRAVAGSSMAQSDWTNNSSPYFSWTAAPTDNTGGSGIRGYCLSLSLDANDDNIPDEDPATSKGLLGTSPGDTTGSTCQFVTTSTTIDFSTASLKGGTWLTTSSHPYLLAIKSVDNAGNIYGGNSLTFKFYFDNTAPTNVSYLSCASGSFSNVADMTFSWPTSGSVASSDDNSQVLGWQYQVNSTAGTWLGTTSESVLGVGNYIPTGNSSRTLTEAQDALSDTNTTGITSGNNVIYFRTVDSAGNFSGSSTYRTCNLSFGGAAPSFNEVDSVTVTPSTATTNSFALSWPDATPTNGQTVDHYYYMVNTTPPSTLSTLQGNASTYIDTDTDTSVSASTLSGVNKGSNTVYVVAIDDATNPNYSPSNYITGTFTLNSTDPDNVGNLSASDSSIKSQSQWNVTLTWTAPSYQGAGNLTYQIYRSTDGSTFTSVGSTSGLSYVDNTPDSTLYYYKVYSQDGANATSSGTNAVSITPTGKWTSPPDLDSGPTVGSITTKKATISWSTSRSADSKVQYGTSSDDYGDVEPSNSTQSTSHSIQLTGLNPSTTYYYKVKWTDEDGNTGTSEEKTFTTASAPTVKDVSAANIGLTSAIIQFTSNNASKVKIYYGTSTSFGGATEVSTSTDETTYTVQLTGLLDGTKYFYKINTFDSEDDEYEGTILDFTTLPRPLISNVRIQQVANTAQSTILVSWSSNTEVSSIITYYPEADPGLARDEVNVALVEGTHRMIIRGLLPQTNYILIVKGRDKIGNEATSALQRITTATDTRPPQISTLKVDGTSLPSADNSTQDQSQLIVSWNTDEPSTSQVEFGEGTGSNYSSKTQEDSNLTYNHLVIISGLTPSKVYHLRAISRDSAGNIGNSIDTTTITPKATERALDLVITNLQEAFGFLGGLGR